MKLITKDIVLKGLKAQAHLVSWNPVGTGTPDYHQSAYFGELSSE